MPTANDAFFSSRFQGETEKKKNKTFSQVFVEWHRWPQQKKLFLVPFGDDWTNNHGPQWWKRFEPLERSLRRKMGRETTSSKLIRTTVTIERSQRWNENVPWNYASFYILCGLGRKYVSFALATMGDSLCAFGSENEWYQFQYLTDEVHYGARCAGVRKRKRGIERVPCLSNKPQPFLPKDYPWVISGSL